MTPEERQQVEAALGIVNQAVETWHPKELDSITTGQQWRQMLAAWSIVSGVVQQTLAVPAQGAPSSNGAHLVTEEVPTDG